MIPRNPDEEKAMLIENDYLIEVSENTIKANERANERYRALLKEISNKKAIEYCNQHILRNDNENRMSRVAICLLKKAAVDLEKL